MPQSRLLILPLLLIALSQTATTQEFLMPGEKSTIYYKIGGGDPVSGAANPLSASVRIGLGGAARLNYSCGRFDAGVTIQNLMNGFSQLGTQVTNAVRAGIASLPLYILQRASPGLYELFQTYQKKAELEWSAALKSCEEMEAIIRDGGNPYEDWVKMAKGEGWKEVSIRTGDAVEAKHEVETEGGVNGVTWIGGARKGGRAQDAIEVIRDLTQAGYNVTMNRAPAANATATFPSSGNGATHLTESFATPKLAADWAVSVLGDRQISLCDEPACQAKAATPGTGLLPKFEAEKPKADAALAAVVTGSGMPNNDALTKASAPGVAVTRELIEALRAMPPTERQIAQSRLAMEIAQARIIDRALLIRNVLLTGAGVPEAGYEMAQNEVHAKVEQMNRFIDDLLFETRVRREVVSNTAATVIDTHLAEQRQSRATMQQPPADPRPLKQGRVQ